MSSVLDTTGSLDHLDPLARRIAIDELQKGPDSDPLPKHLEQFRWWLLGALVFQLREHPETLARSQLFVGNPLARWAANAAATTHPSKLYSMVGYKFPPTLFTGSPLEDDMHCIETGNTREDTSCEVCGKDGVVTTEMTISVGDIPTMRTRVCNCLDSQSSTNGFPTRIATGHQGPIFAGRWIPNEGQCIDDSRSPEKAYRSDPSRDEAIDDAYSTLNVFLRKHPAFLAAHPAGTLLHSGRTLDV